MLPALSIVPAQIRHRRYLPKKHTFNAQLNYLCFDPDQTHIFSQQSMFWSEDNWNVLQLKHADFLLEYSGNLREKVRVLLDDQAQFSLHEHHQIRVIALPRSLGFRFNSVVFIYIFEQQKPVFILSEITNTPWNERQTYVHDCRERVQLHGAYEGYTFQFDKAFHVSPFMPMDLRYSWRFHFSQNKHYILMQLWRKQHLMFDASMHMQFQPITQSSQMHRYALTHVLQPFKMLLAIYIQAFKLWLKRIPFYSHPQKSEQGKK